MPRLFSCPEACRQAEPPPDIRKAVHIRSQIRRVGHIRKDIRSHIRRDFFGPSAFARIRSPGHSQSRLYSQGCVRICGCSGIFGAFCRLFAPRRARARLPQHSQPNQRKTPGSPSQETGGKCLSPNSMVWIMPINGTCKIQLYSKYSKSNTPNIICHDTAISIRPTVD